MTPIRRICYFITGLVVIVQILSAQTHIINLTVQLRTLENSVPVSSSAVSLYSNTTRIDSQITNSSGIVLFSFTITSIPQLSSNQPHAFSLDQNYPNPFNPSTKIEFTLPHYVQVNFRIFDVLGREITSYSSNLNSGVHELEWMPNAAAGIYFYRIIAGDFSQTKKMVLVDGVHGSNRLRLCSSIAINDNNYQSRVAKSAENKIFLEKTTEANYSISIKNLSSTTPQIIDTVIQIINLESDRTVDVYISRFLKPASFDPISNISIKEDNPPADSLIALLHGSGFDKNGIVVPDSAMTYIILNQSNQALIDLKADKNKVKLKSLLQRGNGYSDVTVRALAPNGKYADRSFRVDVSEMRDLIGSLTDYQNNPMLGYILIVNAVGDSAITKTDSTGKFALKMNPSLGDTIKGQIINPNHPNEAFIRTIYVPGSADKTNLVVDAVPLLPDNFYCGADTVVAWVREGNFDYTPIGLKKAPLDSLKEIVTSINKSSGDTIKVAVQRGIMNVLQTNVDTLFSKKPTYYIVPQDSETQRTGYRNAINHFKDHTVSNGTLITWDDNNDGIFEGAECEYRIIMLVTVQNDTLYNVIVISREDFRARVMPNEVGLKTPTPRWLTISHISTTAKAPTIADGWWAKFAEHYAVKTLPENTLLVGNLEQVYKRLNNIFSK